MIRGCWHQLVVEDGTDMVFLGATQEQMDSVHLTRLLTVCRDLLFGRRKSFPVTLSWHGERLMNGTVDIGFFKIELREEGIIIGTNC